MFPVLLIYGKFKQFVILRPKYSFFNDSHFAEACACIISRMNSRCVLLETIKYVEKLVHCIFRTILYCYFDNL